MSQAKSNKTKDRILQISLQLFNERGERSVTTNHIAAELGISPGNLYYHFRNKQEIIKELALQYQKETLEMLALPPERPLTTSDKCSTSKCSVISSGCIVLFIATFIIWWNITRNLPKFIRVFRGR